MRSLRTTVPNLLIACSILLAANRPAITQTAVQQSTSPPITKSSEITRFFPLQVGNRWIYRLRGQQQGSGNRIVELNGRYSDTITTITSIGSVHLIELRREGTIGAHIFCDLGETKDGRFWFIIDDHQLYSFCNKDEATKLAHTLDETPTNSTSDHLEFVLPLALGNSWGADPDSPPRDDGLYQWNVDGKEATALHARFHDCYTVSYRTLPDDEERRICAGVGLVSDEYNHHGTLDQYSIRLVSFVKAAGKL